MKVKFTRASKNDKTLVTVRLSQLPYDIVGGEPISKGDHIKLSVDGVVTVFVVNRLDKNGNPITAATHAFPRTCRLPRVGKPVYAEVSYPF